MTTYNTCVWSTLKSSCLHNNLEFTPTADLSHDLHRTTAAHKFPSKNGARNEAMRQQTRPCLLVAVMLVTFRLGTDAEDPIEPRVEDPKNVNGSVVSELEAEKTMLKQGLGFLGMGANGKLPPWLLWLAILRGNRQGCNQNRQCHRHCPQTCHVISCCTEMPQCCNCRPHGC